MEREQRRRRRKGEKEIKEEEEKWYSPDCWLLRLSSSTSGEEGEDERSGEVEGDVVCIMILAQFNIGLDDLCMMEFLCWRQARSSRQSLRDGDNLSRRSSRWCFSSVWNTKNNPTVAENANDTPRITKDTEEISFKPYGISIQTIINFRFIFSRAFLVSVKCFR